MLHILLIKI